MNNLNMLKYLIINNFGVFFTNIYIISLDFKKIIFTCIITPMCYFIIKFQIYIGFLFLIYFLIITFFLFLLKTEKNVECKEIPVNSDRIFLYCIYNIFFAIPKAKAFIIVYEIIYFIKNKSIKDNKNKLLLIFLFFLIISLIKLTIFFVLGVSYFSILIASNFVIDFFSILEKDSETNKAKYQHIMMNCFILLSDVISSADSKKIIFEKDNIILNMKSNWEIFFLNVKNPELFLQNYYSNPSNTKLMFINNHYGWYQNSEKYKDANLGVNLTSDNFIKVNGISSFLRYGFKPNLVGQNKPNFFTFPYLFKFENNKLQEFPLNYIQKANRLKSSINDYLVENKDTNLIELKNKQFIVLEEKISLENYAKEFQLPIFLQMFNINKFEYINQDWLNTPEGKLIYEQIKLNCRENKFNFIYNNNDFTENNNI